MRKLGLLSCLLLIGAAPPSPDAKLKEIIAPVSGAQMKRTVEKLVSFGTRHTLSSETDHLRPDEHVKKSLAIVKRLQAGKAL